MTSNSEVLTLTQGVKLGVPKNDLEAISMLHVCATIGECTDLTYGCAMRMFVATRRNNDMSTLEALECAVGELLYDSYGDAHDRLSAYRTYLARGGDF